MSKQKPLPKIPPEELLHSMAVRYDHGLGIPGYYDSHPLFSSGKLSHKQRYEAAISLMRQLYEEVSGYGFFAWENPPATLHWTDCEDELPEPGIEVLVWVDGHRGPAWRNNHHLVAYLSNDKKTWYEERHDDKPLLGVTKWAAISAPE